MPLFDFDCRACGRRFEALVRRQDPPQVCPACGGADLERVLSGFAVSSDTIRQTAATRAREKAATEARRENVAMEREIEKHRREDH